MSQGEDFMDGVIIDVAALANRKKYFNEVIALLARALDACDKNKTPTNILVAMANRGVVIQVRAIESDKSTQS